jgi:hypothetical protein
LDPQASLDDWYLIRLGLKRKMVDPLLVKPNHTLEFAPRHR